MSASAGARTHLGLAGLVYLLFVVYGSLVPLDYRAMPLDAAVTAFRQIPWLQLGIGSRADWVANLLLFIPLAFIFTGALAHGRGAAVGLLASVLVLVAGIGLSLGIEFTQLFFPQRTVSQNDIAAESLGAVIGIVAWWAAGPKWVAWFHAWYQEKAPSESSQRLAWGYLIVVFAYGVLPLDLTISGVEIFHKWREGKLNLIPFAGLSADPASVLYELATDVLLWLPLAFLWRLRPGRGSYRVWKRVFGVACLLEGVQVFVYSRSSDVTDLFTAAAGAALGIWLAVQSGAVGAVALGASAPAGAKNLYSSFSWWPLVLAWAWIVVLLGVFWYPFNFYVDGMFLRERLEFLSHAPFVAYYYGTEFRAITEVFHKTLFFAPLGAALAWFVVGTSWRWRDYAAFAAFLLILGVPLGVELGQMLLPEKNPDTTDWALESLGGMLGYTGFKRVWKVLRPRPTASRMARR